MTCYLRTSLKDVQSILEKIRQTIKKEVPGAEETISYKIPTFKINGKYLVYFAGWKNHISLYPIPTGDESFRKEVAKYVAAKGTIKFPLNKPISFNLVKKTVVFLLKERTG